MRLSLSLSPQLQLVAQLRTQCTLALRLMFDFKHALMTQPRALSVRRCPPRGIRHLTYCLMFYTWQKTTQRKQCPVMAQSFSLGRTCGPATTFSASRTSNQMWLQSFRCLLWGSANICTDWSFAEQVHGWSFLERSETVMIRPLQTVGVVFSLHSQVHTYVRIAGGQSIARGSALGGMPQGVG